LLRKIGLQYNYWEIGKVVSHQSIQRLANKRIGNLGVLPSMELNVRIETALSGVIDGAVSFETGLTREQCLDPQVVGYEHHGQGFNEDDKGALPCFFEDLLLGRPMPLTFATPRVQDIDTLVAIALFLHRDLAINPSTAGFVYQVDFVHRRGLPALAHLDEPLARFLSAMRQHFPDKGLSQRELSERVMQAVEWLREYLCQGAIPVLGPQPGEVRILDQGTRGFAVAEATGNLWDGWVDLYRLGFLRGVLVTRHGDRSHHLIAKKSHYVQFDLAAAARLLNQMEVAMGEPPEWRVSADGLWLEVPGGTLILLKDVLQVLTRV
jgi:hypothetical protein